MLTSDDKLIFQIVLNAKKAKHRQLAPPGISLLHLGVNAEQ